MFYPLGADPEFFAAKEGVHKSLIGLLGGTKNKPLPVLESFMKGFAIQEDNVTGEFNIPPAHDVEDWIDYINIMNAESARRLDKLGLNVSRAASAIFPDDQLEDPRAHVFGCDPDFDAWTLQLNPPPNLPHPNMRSCGGHIHIGIECNEETKVGIVRGLDIVVGSWLGLHDPDKEREKIYGKPGAMRFKPYGLEYRRPSNYWTFQDNTFRKELYERVQYVVGRTLGQPQIWTEGLGFHPNHLNDATIMKKWADSFHESR